MAYETRNSGTNNLPNKNVGILLQENGDALLTEGGDSILLEDPAGIYNTQTLASRNSGSYTFTPKS